MLAFSHTLSGMLHDFGWDEVHCARRHVEGVRVDAVWQQADGVRELLHDGVRTGCQQRRASARPKALHLRGEEANLLSSGRSLNDCLPYPL